MLPKFRWVTRIAGASAAVGIGLMIVTAGVAYATVPTLSQTSVTVGVGQSTSVTSTNGTDAYMDLNSAPTVVSVAVNGTQITLTGLAPGTATLTMCGVGTASDCTYLNVTVQIGSVSGISFSSSDLSLTINGSQSVTVSGGNGSYSVTSNSNTSVAGTSLSGNTLTVSGLATGSTTVTICDTSNTCGTLSVTTNSSSASGLSFSANNLSLTAGGSQTVTISGGNGVYNISNNSNPSVISVGMSGANGLIVDASTAGSATITVCDTSNTNTCGTLSVTVAGSGSTSTTNQAVIFSVATPTLAVGQSLSDALSGGASGYVVLSNQNANIVQASVTDSATLSLYGLSAGTDTVTICAIAGGCNALLVTVTGSGAATTPTTTTTTVTPTTTSGTVPSGTVVPNATLISEIQTLQAALTQTLSQIQSMQSQLNQIEAQVNAGSDSVVGTNTSAGASETSYDFTELLTMGSEDAQVTALQQRLTALGFYSGPITGYYGTLTEQAVMKYQTAHSIEATGSVGPETRAALNAGD